MKMSGKKVILYANTDWYLYNFRLYLIRAMRDEGYQVVLVAPAGPYLEKLRAERVDIEPIELDSRLRMGFGGLKACLQIFNIYRRQKPDLVHHFTIKCIFSGGLAARMLGIARIQAVTGLGHLFIDDTFKVRVLRALMVRVYRFVCGGNRCEVIFQNKEDRNLFIEKKIASEGHSRVIRGSGVDCETFKPLNKTRDPGPLRILFVGRLTRQKGVVELIEAARMLKRDGYEFELKLVGDRYPGNPSSLSQEEVDEISRSGTAKVLGHVEDIRPLLHDSDCVVLPSYSEGTPKSLLEAGAAGKAMVASDVPGCRGIVLPGKTGELVKPADSEQLRLGLEKILNNPKLIELYGRRAREIIMKYFSMEIVIEKTLEVYHRQIDSVRA